MVACPKHAKTVIHLFQGHAANEREQGWLFWRKAAQEELSESCTHSWLSSMLKPGGS